MKCPRRSGNIGDRWLSGMRFLKAPRRACSTRRHWVRSHEEAGPLPTSFRCFRLSRLVCIQSVDRPAPGHRPTLGAAHSSQEDLGFPIRSFTKAARAHLLNRAGMKVGAFPLDPCKLHHDYIRVALQGELVRCNARPCLVFQVDRILQSNRCNTFRGKSL